MDAFVCLESGLESEWPVTHLALVGLLPRVKLHVLLEVSVA